MNDYYMWICDLESHEKTGNYLWSDLESEEEETGDWLDCDEIENSNDWEEF